MHAYTLCLHLVDNQCINTYTLYHTLVCRTLLLMRLCCSGCGHHASEHRRLTAVDEMVREEVEKVKSVRCSHLIPLNEIPRSPVFKPHDPIPIPYDSEPDQVCIAIQLQFCLKSCPHGLYIVHARIQTRLAKSIHVPAIYAVELSQIK